jgi:hypothetical protein
MISTISLPPCLRVSGGCGPFRRSGKLPAKLVGSRSVRRAQAFLLLPSPKTGSDQVLAHRHGMWSAGIRVALLSGREYLPFAGYAFECVNPAVVELEP